FNLPRQPLHEAEVMAIYVGQTPEPPAISKAYFMALQLFSQPTDIRGQLNELQLFLRAHDREIPRTDLQDLWGYVLNYSMREMMKSEGEFDDLTDAIYVHFYESGLILDEGKLSAFHFTNIVSVRLEMEAFDWVRAFLKEIEGRLINDFEGSAIQFGWGLLHFSSGEHGEAIRIFKALLEDPPKDLYYNLELRSLLLKAYYAHKDQLSLAARDEMEALANSFRIFLTRNENIPAASRRNYQNFIRFFLRFHVLLDDPATDRKKLEKLRDEIEVEKDMVSRKWLLKGIRKHLLKEF
ncbi:MAG: hypothetical protein AAF570_26325, partial [Bacteroidota bacterium]